MLSVLRITGQPSVMRGMEVDGEMLVAPESASLALAEGQRLGGCFDIWDLEAPC